MDAVLHSIAGLSGSLVHVRAACLWACMRCGQPVCQLLPSTVQGLHMARHAQVNGLICHVFPLSVKPG